tara:strand:+ start:1349 stop:1651 length:303 start_codon:yes stop_codon:yes gene_type:complete
MDAKEILENYLNQMQDAHKEFSSAKNSLMEVALSPFEPLFIKDNNGNRVASHLKKNDIEKLLKSINDDLIPMLEENKYEAGINKVTEWKKLLKENLEKQK